MKQIITLNFGQTGINISDQTLSFYRKENGLDLPPQNALPTPSLKQSLVDAKYNRVFFYQNQAHTFNYRSISIDCDPYSTNELLKGSNKDYYKKSNMIYSKSATGCIYSRGCAIAVRELNDQIVQTLQKTVQACDNLQGVMVNVAMLGGTSGVFHHTLQTIVGQEYLKKKIVVSNLLFPSQKMANSIVEIYNYCLAFKVLIEYSSLNIPYDNQSLYRICEQAGIDNPGYYQLNQVIAGMQSSLTQSLRSNGILNNNLNEMVTNLVCYPRINLVYPSSIPMVSSDRLHDRYFTPVNQLTRNIFDPNNRLINMHGVQNKIAVGLYYQGDVDPNEVYKSVQNLREQKSSNFKFQQWSPLGLKIGINKTRPFPHHYRQLNSLHYPLNRTCCSLTSAMEFNKLLAYNNHKFDMLYAKRAYVYTFIQDSMEEGDFTFAREDLAALQKDYQTWEIGYQEEQQ